MPAAVISVAARSASAIIISFTNPEAAGVDFVWELNRAADFSSDDSLSYAFRSVQGGNEQTFDGLPSDTPFYMRIYSTQTGLISNVLYVATDPTALNLAYTGYSIDKAMLVVPEGVVEVSQAGGFVVPGYPLSNMLDDSPTSTTRFGGNSGNEIFFQTSGAPIDTIAILGTLMGDDADWLITCYSDAARTNVVYSSGFIPFRCSPTIGRRPYYHALHVIPAPLRNPYWRIILRSAATVRIVRNLVVGLARRSVNASRGWSQGMNDQGSASRTRFGDIDRVTGWRGRSVDFEMSWLSEAEYQTKWADLPVAVGRTKSVLAIPNSKRNVFLNDRIAFGPITDWRGENVQSTKHSQTIAIDSSY